MTRPKEAKRLGGAAEAQTPAENTRCGPGGSAQAPGDEAAALCAPTSWPLVILAAGVIVLATLAAYHNSLAGPFAYDDEPSILANRTIRQLWPLGPVLSPPCNGETVGGRPLLNLTLAINYALGGLNVRGYHAANLAIHIAAALLLFGILRRTLLTRPLRDRFDRASTLLALAGAMLWAVHPLHTESVTYIVQRAESLMGLFYLLTLYCVIRGAGEKKGAGVFFRTPCQTTRLVLKKDSRPPFFWYTAAVLACLLGMACKEVMVTAPLIVLLYDRTFLAGSFAKAWQRRWGLYVGLAVTWGLLAYLMYSTGLIVRQREMGAPDAWSYARSQPGVILYYLRLSVWPSSLCFDYAWPLATSLGEILPGAMVLGLLLAATLWGLIARRGWAFLSAWFFLILAPTSSVLPLGQLAFEHRMYLPLAAIVALAVAGGYALWERLLFRPAGQGGQAPFSPGMTPGEVGWWGAKKGTVPDRGAAALRWAAPVVLWAAALLALGCTTVARNRDYRSLVALYQDTVDKRPHNPVAHNNLGNALVAAGRSAEAIEHCRQAVRLKPDGAVMHYNLAIALVAAGRTDEGIEQYREALRLNPDYVEAHYSFGNALAKLSRTKEAIAQYRQALRLKPEHVMVHNNLGIALVAVGGAEEAIQHYREALRIIPDNAEIHNNLAIALDAVGKTGEAIGEYREALRLKPDFATADYNLGLALAKVGRADEAIERYREALRLRPDFALAHFQLAEVLDHFGRTKEAAEHYRRHLQLMPDSKEALRKLAWLLATSEPAPDADPSRAVGLAERARQLSGQENAPCLDTLAAAYAAAGRFPDAIFTADRAVQLAEFAGQAPLAKLILARLELYRSGRPYRQAPHAPAQTKP
jgi:tetratricopeptide (TPR) repeat protein